jgi:hypothetical protein
VGVYTKSMAKDSERLRPRYTRPKQVIPNTEKVGGEPKTVTQEMKIASEEAQLILMIIDDILGKRQ